MKVVTECGEPAASIEEYRISSKRKVADGIRKTRRQRQLVGASVASLALMGVSANLVPVVAMEANPDAGAGISPAGQAQQISTELMKQQLEKAGMEPTVVIDRKGTSDFAHVSDVVADENGEPVPPRNAEGGGDGSRDSEKATGGEDDEGDGKAATQAKPSGIVQRAVDATEKSASAEPYYVVAVPEGASKAESVKDLDGLLMRVDNEITSMCSLSTIINDAKESGALSEEEAALLLQSTDPLDDTIKALEKAACIDIAYQVEIPQYQISEMQGNLALLEQDQEDETVSSGLKASAQANRKTVISDSMWFDQNDYPGQYYQNWYDIPTYGCGLCSTTCAVNMLWGTNYDPPYIASLMSEWASENGVQYCVYAGTSWPGWADTVEGCLNVSVRKAESTDDIKDELSKGNMLVAGAAGGVFQSGGGGSYWSSGHVLCFYKTDGENVWAKDSAGSAGGPSVMYTADEFEDYWHSSGSNRSWIVSRAE